MRSKPTQATRRFGRAVRERRNGKGMTQAALGKKIGRGRQSVLNLEAGTVAPTFHVLRALCRVLECGASDLVT